MLAHPLASELMECLEAWIAQESLGQPAAAGIARLGTLASRMLQFPG